MRLVDEITELPAAPKHEAHSGSPVRTALPRPTPLAELNRPEPFAPRLPPAIPKTHGPATGSASGQVPATMTASQSRTIGVAPKPKGKWRRKLLIASAIVVATVATVGLVFRNSALVERFTGKGYDNNPLPTHDIALPKIGGVEYTFSSQSVAITNGLPTNYWSNERDQVNFTTKSATVTLDEAKASIIGRSIGTPQSLAPPQQLMIDERFSYRPGATPSDPWIRKSYEPGSTTGQLLSHNEVRMYQDVFDPTLRARHPSTIVGEIRHDVPVTTYTYSFEFVKFYESAPRLFEMMRGVDGNAADDATVTVTISLDEQWMVRYLDVNVDYNSVLEHRAKKDIGMEYPYRYTIDVISTAVAPTISVPAKVVDEPSAQSTTTVGP
jgi:hypothetical protein